MADSINSNYAGEASRGYVEGAVMSATSLSNIRVEEGIKFKQNLRVIGTSGLVQDADCDFTDAGDLNLSERVLEPKELKVNKQLCKSDFIPTWEAQNMGAGAGSDEPTELIDFVFASIAKKVAKSTEKSIWQGDKTQGGEFDGFTTLFADDTDVQTVDSAPLTTLNIVDEMTKVANAVMADEDLRDAEGLAIFVSPQDAFLYAQYLTVNHGAAGLAPNTNIPVGSFLGIDVVIANGLPSGEMVATYRDNLVFGTDLMSDMNEASLIDMSPIDGSKNMRFVLNYRAGVQYAISSDIVYYRAAA